MLLVLLGILPFILHLYLITVLFLCFWLFLKVLLVSSCAMELLYLALVELFKSALWFSRPRAPIREIILVSRTTNKARIHYGRARSFFILFFVFTETMWICILFRAFLIDLDWMSFISWHAYCCKIFGRRVVYSELESLFIIVERTFFLSLMVDLSLIKLAHIDWWYSFIVFVLDQLRVMLHTFLTSNAPVWIMLQILIHISVEELLCVQMSKAFSCALCLMHRVLWILVFRYMVCFSKLNVLNGSHLLLFHPSLYSFIFSNLRSLRVASPLQNKCCFILWVSVFMYVFIL
jgi:hypothetical protein